ncbi:MAG: Asp-tRNA(Asn)/Glu-tRNA(Gln) amidotransferase subunit GatC [Acidobacteria bacterium]|nr:MAG: Asp-tRNA(Asn)/Glu-tRNA(Gln) amidotransferase subunit GatC [Acidobacteriota bacterium]
MDKLDDREVRQLAELAHLALSDDERASFRGQLEAFLGYAERIQALNTVGVEPTSHALLEAGLEGGSRLRDDRPRESLDRKAVLDQAPDASDGLFKVPKVLP